MNFKGRSLAHGPGIIFLLIFAMCGGVGFGDQFKVANTSINVPIPAGYVRVTEEMPQLKRFLDQLVDPMNDTLAVYIPEQLASAALAGGAPALERYLILKVNKKMRNRTVGVDEFRALKAAVRQQNQKVIEEVNRKLPEYFAGISKGLSSNTRLSD